MCIPLHALPPEGQGLQYSLREHHSLTSISSLTPPSPSPHQKSSQNYKLPKGLHVCVCAQSCLCSHRNCSPPDSSVRGILQARVLEWVAISFSRGSSRPRDPALQESLYYLSHQGSPRTQSVKIISIWGISWFRLCTFTAEGMINPWSGN